MSVVRIKGSWNFAYSSISCVCTAAAQGDGAAADNNSTGMYIVDDSSRDSMKNQIDDPEDCSE